MLLRALTATLSDFGFGLALAAIAYFLCWLIVRSTRKLQEREDARRVEVHREPDWQWPHPRAHESIVPRAGRKAA